MFFRTDNIKYYLVPLALFYSLLTFMGLININEYSSSFFDFSIFLNILVFWIMINHERKDYMVLEKAMLCFALGAIALSLCFNLGIGVIYERGRLSMFGDDQNYIGSRTSIGIIILILAVVQNRLKMGWYRFLLILPIPLMLKLLFETGSRLGFIAFILSLGAGIVLYRTKNIGSQLAVIAIGIATFIMIGMVLIQSETMVKRIESVAESGDTGGRAEIWNSLLPIVKQNPVFGVGHTGYIYQTKAIYGDEISPHNVILEILCYTGIVGLGIYFVFLYRIGSISYISYKKNDIMLPIILLIPTVGMILSIQILNKKIGWIIFAYIIGSSVIKNFTNKIETKAEPSEISN